ncbi:MAG: endolytic transglycosylase MltG [Rhodospirillaceae bacterium]|nr:endolytic transglycosylase MltG [Rhodospirillaceae bacterium]
MKRALILIFIFIFVPFMVVSTAWLWMGTKVVNPGPSVNDVRIIIKPGYGVSQIASELERSGVIDSQLVFKLRARLTNTHKTLKAGEYNFPAHVSIGGALQLLKSGNTVVRKLTIPEGLYATAIIDLVMAADGLEGDIKNIPSEGVLLPETYHYSWGDSRQGLINRMEEDMISLLDRLWAERKENTFVKSIDEVLILASIVEKETAIDAERSRIAGVFINRLKKGMRLQSDPTVVYAITNGQGEMGRELTRNDLAVESPFNTYRNKGLPPGAIANPGKASIVAVLAPIDTDELYFVADGTGGHVFARSLKEHNQNVAKWRKLKRANQGQ